MMKKIRIGLAIGIAIAALGLAKTAVPEAKAGGIYWNNHGGRGVVTAPNGAYARGCYGHIRCIGY